MLVVAVVAAAGCTTAAVPDPGPPSVTLAPDRPATLAVDDRWSIEVPPGAAGTAGAVLSASPAPAPDLAGGTVLAAADVSLSSGQPVLPVTMVYRFATPVPDDQVVYLLDDEGDGNDFRADPDPDAPLTTTRVRVATLSPDRMVASVQVDHLSFKSWVIDLGSAVLNVVGQLTGNRFDAPTCTPNRPEWLDDAVFVDDLNAPMLVCVGADPADANLLVVKVTNNRASGLVVTAPVRPAWSYQTLIDQPDLQDWMPELATAVLGRLNVPVRTRHRSYVLPPGESVHLGFTREALAGTPVPARIVGSVGPAVAVAGIVAGLLAQSMGDDIAFALGAGIVLECLPDDAGDLRADARTTLTLLATVIRCGAENAKAVTNQIIRLTSPSTWNRIGGDVVAGARIGKQVLSRFAAVATYTVLLVDLGTLFALTPDDLTVALFLKAPARPRRPTPQAPEPEATGLPVISVGAGWVTPTSLRVNLALAAGSPAAEQCAILVDDVEVWSGGCPPPGAGIPPTVDADGGSAHTVRATATNAAGTATAGTEVSALDG